MREGDGNFKVDIDVLGLLGSEGLGPGEEGAGGCVVPVGIEMDSRDVPSVWLSEEAGVTILAECEPRRRFVHRLARCKCQELLTWAGSVAM